MAMYLGWGFMHNLFKSLWPETDFLAALKFPRLPRMCPAYHRHNGESTFGSIKKRARRSGGGTGHRALLPGQ